MSNFESSALDNYFPEFLEECLPVGLIGDEE